MKNPLQQTNIRYRGIWPIDSREPIIHATADCIMRLLSNSTFNGYAKGKVAYAIEAKVIEAQKKHDLRWAAVVMREREMKEKYPFIQENEPVPHDLVDMFKADNEKHKMFIMTALEGELFTLESHEIELLQQAVEKAHIREEYVDPSRVFNPVIQRWYMPILAVIMGDVVEPTHKPVDLNDESLI